MGKLITVEQLSNFATGFAAKNDARFIKKTALEVVKAETAEDGYLSSYKLMLDGETQLGATINIAKDYVITKAEVKVCAAVDTPIEGLNVGDKYIDLTVNVKAGATDETHLYIAVKDLVDPFNAGNGITIGSDNAISIKIDAENANGLSVDSAGLKLGLAVAPDAESGELGSAGAMSAADKAKLDNLLNAYTGSDPIEVSESGVISIKAATAPDTDAGITGNAGSMSAEDKAKLDGIIEATDPEIQAIIDSLYTTSGS